MPGKVTGMPNGRPLKKIDQKSFESLCGLQCTIKEVCFFFDCCEETLNTWCKKTYGGKTFSAVYDIKRSAGLISLRRNILKQSEDKPAVAIFLAKNLLGMRDVVENINTEERLSELKETFRSVDGNVQADQSMTYNEQVVADVK